MFNDIPRTIAFRGKLIFFPEICLARLFLEKMFLPNVPFTIQQYAHRLEVRRTFFVRFRAVPLMSIAWISFPQPHGDRISCGIRLPGDVWGSPKSESPRRDRGFRSGPPTEDRSCTRARKGNGGKADTAESVLGKSKIVLSLFRYFSIERTFSIFPSFGAGLSPRIRHIRL